MWSDELDKKISETTEGSHHAFDDKAWNKMEELLDKHLPQKRRRRFIALFLLPLALIGTGVFFALQKQYKNNVTGKKITTVQPILATESTKKETGIKTAKINPTSENINDPVKQSETEDAISTDEVNKPGLSKQPSPDKKIGQRRSRQTAELPAPDRNTHGEKKPEKVLTQLITDENKNITSTPLAPTKDITSAEKTVDKEKKDAGQAGVESQVTKTKSSKTKSSTASNFSITLSAGPDLSSVNFEEPGEWRMQYGIGISYALSKKFSLRTGFYTSRKIYTADPEDYHSYYNPPPSLQKIDANCLVYEIPVNLTYSFSARKKHNWFVAGGLSSYLMKEETYDYVYKNPWGPPQIHTYVYKNENSHFFSVLNLSGGYQYHFSHRFSLMAEPYVKIPLSGVGEGKVNLNSGGILFTAGFKPFLRRN